MAILAIRFLHQDITIIYILYIKKKTNIFQN